jgi:hypothetical protein
VPQTQICFLAAAQGQFYTCLCSFRVWSAWPQAYRVGSINCSSRLCRKCNSETELGHRAERSICRKCGSPHGPESMNTENHCEQPYIIYIFPDCHHQRHLGPKPLWQLYALFPSGPIFQLLPLRQSFCREFVIEHRWDQNQRCFSL